MAKSIKNSDDNLSEDTFTDMIEEIDKEFGLGSLMLFSGPLVKVDSFPTGVMSLDLALGVDGLPIGRVIELFGAESSGKTTLTLQLIAACQRHYFEDKKRFGRAVFVDAEHALDPEWASNIGVRIDKLPISQPMHGEEALNIVEKLVLSGRVDLIIVDSVAALVPLEEIQGEVGEHHIGAQARMMSQACRKLSAIAGKQKTTIIFINQVREKIGVKFGNPEVTPGGRALKFYASIRMEVIKGSAVKIGDATVGFRPTVKVVKNKVAPPFKKANFDICFGHPERPVYGIDCMSSMIDVAEQFGIIGKKGSHYSYDKIVLGNGLANSSKYLRENPDTANEIREKIRGKTFGNISVANVTSLDPIDDEIIDSDDTPTV